MEALKITRYMRRILPMVLLLLIFRLMLFCVSASAESSPLRLSIAADQPELAVGETAWLTLTLENLSGMDCYDVDVRHLLPDDLQYFSDNGYFYFPVIPAGETKTCIVGVKPHSFDLSITVSSDKRAYRFGDIATLTCTVRNNTTSPLYDVELLSVLPDELIDESGSDDRYAYLDVLEPMGTVTRTYLVSSAYPDVLVRIDADKDHYAPGETACLSLSIHNRSDEILKDVSVEHLLPEGMIYDLERNESNFRFVSIAPREAAECKVYVQYVKTDLPDTGDSSSIWFVLLAASVSLLELVCIYSTVSRRKVS